MEKKLLENYICLILFCRVESLFVIIVLTALPTDSHQYSPFPFAFHFTILNCMQFKKRKLFQIG